MLDVLAETFAKTIEECRAVPASTVGPGYFAPMQVDEFVASRVVEAVVHGLDLTLALGREPIASSAGLALTAFDSRRPAGAAHPGPAPGRSGR